MVWAERTERSEGPSDTPLYDYLRNKNLMGYIGLTRQIILSVMTAKVARFVWMSA